MPQNIDIKTKIIVTIIAAFGLAGTTTGVNAQDMEKRPALVITNKPMPGSEISPFYNRPTKTPDITPQQLIGDAYYQPTDTVVSRKIGELRNDLFSLQSSVERLSKKLEDMEGRNQALSAEYFANTATINTQLQSGTTPGNPRLVQRLSTAQMNLDGLSRNVAELNSLAVQVANSASIASFLLEASRSTYGLSGAVEEDHARLSQLEDQINNQIVTIDRLLNAVNDNITRTAAYLSSERSNLRTLALGISNGDLYGRSLANRPFSSVPQSSLMQPASIGGMPAPIVPQATRPTSPRPLAKIRFDKAQVDYEQPVFIAVSEAMERYPDARFELIAVHPTTGNAAQMAIESTRARRNAEKVLRTITQMGLPSDKIDLSYNADANVTSNEVHIFIR
ncbi:MAG: hypothetical protein AAF569_00255 [Pseudomonadota bacterium]